MKDLDYWSECVSSAANECGVSLTPGQIDYIARAISVSHEQYGMAFYSPPDTDRIAALEREWKLKLEKSERDLNEYRVNAEEAVKLALHCRSDDVISIGRDGEVCLHGGRTKQIQ